MQSDLSITDDLADHLLSLPFDHYQRYSLTRQIVSLVRSPDSVQALRVLDVGGHMSSLKLFLPEAVVVVADPQGPPPTTHRALPFKYDSYVRAGGQQLPFADSSFHLVTAHDTLEHVPGDQREPFLREVLRVARELVLVNGPVFHPETRAAEERLDSFIQRLFNTSNPSLTEHLELGLPDPGLIERVIDEEHLPFVAIPNGNLAWWLTMMALKHYLAALPDGESAHEALDRAYNAAISPGDFQGLCYRCAYVIATDESGVSALQRIAAAFPPAATPPSAAGTTAKLDRLVHEMECHAASIIGKVSELAEKELLLRHRDDLLGQQDAALAAKDASLAAKDALLGEKDASLAQKDAAIADKDRHIANTEAALHHANVQAASSLHQLELITNSVGYRLLERVRRPIRWLTPEGSHRRGAFVAFSKGLNIIMTRGWRAFFARLVRVREWLPRLRAVSIAAHPTVDDQYQLWLQAHALTSVRARRIKQQAARLHYRPLVSIVMPVYNPEPAWLRDAIESVRAQLYDNWELCIADDGSTRAGVRELLDESSQADERIKVTHSKKNQGIAAASNAALALATGEFIGLLDHDDELTPDALFEVVKLLNERQDLDYIYSDEDKKEPDGRLVEPSFKPDWSPDLLMSVNYVTHFSVFRKRLIDDLGGFRRGYDGSQDYDLVLRAAEITNKVAHIAEPLYTWRKVPGSAASSTKAKGFAYRAGKKALRDALARRGLKGEVLDGLPKGRYRVRYKIVGSPKVAIIIPTRDRVDMLRRCVQSVEKKSSYGNYEIIVVDNSSQDQETLDYLSSLKGKVIKYPHEFNFAKIINTAARETDGDALLLLNNDTEIITADWIEAMLEHGQRPEVAAVGARLIYPDGRVQHEGIIIGLGGGSAGNVDHGGYFGLGESIRNCSAVTGACMLTRSSVFWELGGFDDRLGVAFNDVDFCLRARDKGYLIVYTPYALLYHHESASRGTLHPHEDEKLFRQRWGDPGEYRDPYYNPNLDLWFPFNLRV